MPQPPTNSPSRASLHQNFNYEDCGQVLSLISGDTAIAAGQTTLEFGRVIERTEWVRRILVHVLLGGRAQPVVYRRVGTVWDIGTLMTDITFGIATLYPLEMEMAGTSALRVELKNTDGVAPLTTASVFLQLYGT